MGGDARRGAPREARVLILGPPSANLETFRVRGDGAEGHEVEILGEEVRGVVARSLQIERWREAPERPAGTKGIYSSKIIVGWRSRRETNRRTRRGARARGNGASRSRTHHGSAAWSSTHSKSTKAMSSKENSSDPDVCASRGWGSGWRVSGEVEKRDCEATWGARAEPTERAITHHLDVHRGTATLRGFTAAAPRHREGGPSHRVHRARRRRRRRFASGASCGSTEPRDARSTRIRGRIAGHANAGMRARVETRSARDA